MAPILDPVNFFSVLTLLGNFGTPLDLQGAIKAGKIVHVARTNVDANAIVLFEFWKFQGSSSTMRQFPVSSSNVLIIQTLRF